MIFIKVTLDRTSCIFTKDEALGIVTAEIDAMHAGETLQVEVVEMTQEQFDNLPEFKGW